MREREEQVEEAKLVSESLNQKISNEREREMASNPDFIWCKEERKQESFFKVVNSLDISSDNMVNYVLNSSCC